MRVTGALKPTTEVGSSAVTAIRSCGPPFQTSTQSSPRFGGKERRPISRVRHVRPQLGKRFRIHFRTLTRSSWCRDPRELRNPLTFPVAIQERFRASINQLPSLVCEGFRDHSSFRFTFLQLRHDSDCAGHHTRILRTLCEIIFRGRQESRAARRDCVRKVLQPCLRRNRCVRVVAE